MFFLKVNYIAFSLEFFLVVTDRLLVDKTKKTKTTVRRLMVSSFMLRLSWLFRWGYFSNPRFCHWLGGSCFHIHLFFIKYTSVQKKSQDFFLSMYFSLVGFLNVAGHGSYLLCIDMFLSLQLNRLCCWWPFVSCSKPWWLFCA